jgi:hypothetical protein
MLLIAVALLVPVVAVSIVTAELIAPVLDSRSALAQLIAFAGYALSGATCGFVLGRERSQERTGHALPVAGERRGPGLRFLIIVAILILPLLGLNLVLAADRMAFLQWQLRVFTVLILSGVAGFWLRRLADSRHSGV